MMLILGETTAPGDSVSASKLPEPDIERDIVFKPSNARATPRNGFELRSH
jgi:hypothetical protein